MENKDFYINIDGKPVKVTEEVYHEYYRGIRKERYMMEDIKKARAVISPDAQDLVRELYYLGKTEREAASALHMAKTTLRRKHAKALQKLRKVLGEYF